MPSNALYYHSLRRQAQSQMDAYEQYDRAYWDQYTQHVRIKWDVETKMGTAFLRGDQTIACRGYRGEATVWSFRNRCATLLVTGEFELIGECS